jgi:hypothetical protein
MSKAPVFRSFAPGVSGLEISSDVALNHTKKYAKKVVLETWGKNKKPGLNFFPLSGKAFRFSRAGKVGEKSRPYFCSHSHAFLACKDWTLLDAPLLEQAEAFLHTDNSDRVPKSAGRCRDFAFIQHRGDGAS